MDGPLPQCFVNQTFLSNPNPVGDLPLPFTFIYLFILLLLLLLCNVFILKVYEEQCEVENVNFEIGRMKTCEDSSKASHPLLVGILLIALLLLWF